MTQLGKVVILGGVLAMLVGTLSWIYTTNWQWVAGGIAVFISSMIAGAVLSVETKDKRPHTIQPTPPSSNTRYTDNEFREPTNEESEDDTPSPKTL